ncbi:MAG: N-acetyl-gamma-glutamyl-phosphate reductase [Lutibacter sp.]|jgi:N-acetyl-gamma-glutamyl-phosphate reductase|nr:N-acetyl-gamma-glutamyl-phosphate reductase [Lutibacter sp.]
MIKVGIIGGAGYTAGELIRLLVNHSEVRLDFIYSTTRAGDPVSQVHQDLLGSTDLVFTDTVNPSVAVVFLCLGHGNSSQFLASNTFSDHTRIIDLSNDFRLQKGSVFQGRFFVYGLPELHKKNIKKAQNIANPGCFATAIQLALLPLAKAGLLNDSIHINATTGATGAGVSPGPTTHFSWRDNNFSVYKAFTHQHLAEISEGLQHLQKGFSQELCFIPNRGNFSRGIFASVYLTCNESLEEAFHLYESYYQEAPFTHLSRNPIHLKQVVNTNNCVIHLSKYQDRLLITTAIDNLLKGASGQAIENMNIAFGFDQNQGLQLKSTSF